LSRKSKPIENGKIVYIKYLDHSMFNFANPNLQEPIIRETVGWLQHQNENFLVIVWDKTPNLDNKNTGLTIVRSCILEIREVG